MGGKHKRDRKDSPAQLPLLTEPQKPLSLGRDCSYKEELRRLQIELVKL
jgi:hypothetical protein